MSESGWYGAVEGTDLFQGDLIRQCPVIVAQAPSAPVTPGTEEIKVEVLTYDLIVMTQSCDLANEKTSDVLLAQAIAWPELVHEEVTRGNQVVKSSKFRKMLVEGNVNNLSLLHKHEGTPPLPWSVVDFRRLFTVSKSFLASYAESLGPRLRLRSPYREHLAQAFARYFMRVGLPHDAKAFELEGDVKV